MSANMNKNWVSVCSLEALPQSGGRTVRAGGMEIALFRLSDDRIRAVENRCPHKQGPLAEGIVSGDTIICPLHARKINLTSGEVLPPDSGCVTTYRVKVKNGRILLEL